jgi:hypothetical protein
MITKQILKDCIQLLQQQDEITKRLDLALSDFNSSFTVLETDKYTRQAFDKLLSLHINADGLDLIGWWMYENVNKIIYNSDKTETDLTDIDSFVEYMINNYLIK